MFQACSLDKNDVDCSYYNIIMLCVCINMHVCVIIISGQQEKKMEKGVHAHTCVFVCVEMVCIGSISSPPAGSP